LHLVPVALMLLPPGGAALESGTGDDEFNVDQGIAIEGFARFGPDQATVDAVEVPTSQLSEARPQIEEVKAVEPVEEPPPPDVETAELPEDTELLRSENGPEQEDVRPKKPDIEELEEARPEQMATLEQPEEIAVKEERSSGAERRAGQATLSSAYLGQLRNRLERAKVNPRSRVTGTVVVRFTVASSGVVISREVATSSGSKVLDDAAVASLDRASPFPPFPTGVDQEPVVISVPFRFLTR
jgi:protein TonB